MDKKKIYLISLAAFTLVLSVILFITAFRISSANIARIQLEEEISSLNAYAEKLKSENKQLKEEIDKIDTELSSKAAVNSDYMDYKKSHDALKSEIDELKSRSAELDEEIEKKQREADNASLSDSKRGGSYPLTKNEMYTCPESVPEGRYKAKGSGTLTVISSAGKVRLSQNLDTSYDNSYTFNLNDGDRIRVTGDITLTEIK